MPTTKAKNVPKILNKEHFLRGFGIGFVLGFLLAAYITIKLVEKGIL